MGIDFSHCDARWGYIGFHKFRKKVAKAVGIDLDVMPGFSLEPSVDWPDPYDEPIARFLGHSDCDGHLTPEECAAVAPRLKELVEQFPPDDPDRKKGLDLAEGMALAAEVGELFEFM